MVQKLKQRKSEGFTIIEVLIVLAIAGLILLIVFLAVPNLQRTSRNTQRKNDVSAISSAIGNFSNDNGGLMPQAVQGDGSDTNVVVFSNPASPNTDQAKLGYYTVTSTSTPAAVNGNVAIATVSGTTTVEPTVKPSGTTVSSSAVTTDGVVVVIGETCNSTGTGVGQVSARSAAIFYATETGSGNGALQCLEE